MPDCTLIFSHQLSNRHPALGKGRPVVLTGDSLIFGSDPHVDLKVRHQKSVSHRALEFAAANHTPLNNVVLEFRSRHPQAGHYPPMVRHLRKCS